MSNIIDLKLFDLVEKIKNSKLFDVEFIPADGYSDFR